jgi:hypothetical protein
MSARISSKTLIGAIRRKIESLGGQAMVLTTGDEVSGAVLLVLADRGIVSGLCERGLAPDGTYRWVTAGPEAPDGEALDSYLESRRKFDPDLWILEIDQSGEPVWLEEFIGAD